MGRVAERRHRFLNTLSGRFLILTVIFVMLAEIMIFVPSIARYRADFLLTRLKQAQIAALTQLATEETIMPELEAELLANAEVYNVVAVLRFNPVIACSRADDVVTCVCPYGVILVVTGKNVVLM